MAASEPNRLAVRCPQCGAGFHVAAEMAGKQGRCRCGHVFSMPEASAAAATPPPKRPPTQYVGVSCRVCQTRMFGRLDQVGRSLKCPDCGAFTVLPPPEPERPKAQPAALEGDQYELWGVDEAPSNAALLAAQSRYIAVECRLCQTLMYATREQVGKKIKCPDCRTVTVVPAPVARKPQPSKTLLEDGYELEEVPVLVEPPPVIVPPRRPMVYEEERDAVLARQAERRAQGKKGGPQYDVHGHPILPRWPLVTRVLPFLFSPGVPVRWIVLSAGSFAILMLLSSALSTIGPAGGRVATSIAVIGGVCMGLFAAMLGMIWFAAASNILLTIVVESSEGNDHVQEWPPMNFADWLAYLFSTVIALMVSALPGWLVGQLALDEGPPRAIAVGISLLGCLPIVVLSQLDIGSMFAILSGRVLKSLATCFLSWTMFYLEIAAIVAICFGVMLSGARLGPAVVLLEIPLIIGALFLAARLLGRLAWKLAEAMPAVEEGGGASQDG